MMANVLLSFANIFMMLALHDQTLNKVWYIKAIMKPNSFYQKRFCMQLTMFFDIIKAKRLSCQALIVEADIFERQPIEDDSIGQGLIIWLFVMGLYFVSNFSILLQPLCI